MSKLNRFTQLLFGSTAGANRMSEFGSLQAGSPATYSGSTITPAIIQTLSNYLSGWDGAVIQNASPALQDLNALCYLFAYQLAYLMQEGAAEWDSSTTYFIGSIVNSAGFLYESLVDNNLNNVVTDTTKWYPVFGKAVGARHSKAGTVSASNATISDISFDTTDYDTGGGSPLIAGAPSKFTAPISGLYTISFSIQWDANVTGNRQVRFIKNNSTVIRSQQLPAAVNGSDTTVIGGTVTLSLAAGDTVGFQSSQNSGGSLNYGGDITATWASACLVSRN